MIKKPQEKTATKWLRHTFAAGLAVGLPAYVLYHGAGYFEAAYIALISLIAVYKKPHRSQG